jgi:hypothetical protein
MRNRPIVVRLRPYTSQLTGAQLNSLTKQEVIDNISPSLNAQELEELDDWGKYAISWLKGEWIRTQHQGFIEGKIRDVITTARQNAIDYMVLQGLSTETASRVFKDGFQAFSEEVLDG